MSLYRTCPIRHTHTHRVYTYITLHYITFRAMPFHSSPLHYTHTYNIFIYTHSGYEWDRFSPPKGLASFDTTFHQWSKTWFDSRGVVSTWHGSPLLHCTGRNHHWYDSLSIAAPEQLNGSCPLMMCFHGFSPCLGFCLWLCDFAASAIHSTQKWLFLLIKSVWTLAILYWFSRFPPQFSTQSSLPQLTSQVGCLWDATWAPEPSESPEQSLVVSKLKFMLNHVSKWILEDSTDQLISNVAWPVSRSVFSIQRLGAADPRCTELEATAWKKKRMEKRWVIGWWRWWRWWWWWSPIYIYIWRLVESPNYKINQQGVLNTTHISHWGIRNQVFRADRGCSADGPR